MKKSGSRPRKKPGAKPKGPYEQKIRTLTTRITEGTRKKLKKAATMSGRSLSQEIELRLNKSLDQDDVRYQDFGGEIQYRMCRMFADIGNSMAVGALQSEGAHWSKTKGAFIVALSAWKAVMMRMLRDDFIFSSLPPDEIEKLGVKIGSKTAVEIAKARENVESRE